mmetsp:Transcript_4594/g.8226  ORF Transcript_4594/g.8226 Transcript_4594/m.8226 type:complete len:345 (+) Transcript_4594:229-1263(+)
MTMLSRQDIEDDPIRDGIEKDTVVDENDDAERQHDQLPTVDQILVERGQGRMLSGGTLADDDDDNESDQHRRSRSCIRNKAVKILLLTMGIVAGFAIGFLAGEWDEEKTAGAPKQVETGDEITVENRYTGGGSPVPVPTPQRLDVTQQDLVDHLNLDGSEFANSKSYQSRALDVLIENGVAAEDGPNTPNGRQKLAQRYALLCLYYSTNGVRTSVTDAQFGYGTCPKWHNSNIPAPWKFQWEDDECDWSGVVCDERGLVKRIELANHLMTGFLPMELGLLGQGPIEVLDFSDNRGLGEGGFPDVFSEFNSLGKFCYWWVTLLEFCIVRFFCFKIQSRSYVTFTE